MKYVVLTAIAVSALLLGHGSVSAQTVRAGGGLENQRANRIPRSGEFYRRPAATRPSAPGRVAEPWLKSAPSYGAPASPIDRAPSP